MSNSNIRDAQDQSVEMMERSATRHFYAVKEDAKGGTPYVFERIADRNAWMQRHESARPATATDVYKMLRKQRHAILAANRTNRVYIVDNINEIDTSKGHRLILS